MSNLARKGAGSLLCWFWVLMLMTSAMSQDILPPANLDDAPAPATLISPLDMEHISISIRWVAREYLDPETEKVDRNYLTFESFDESAGEDVRVEIWGLPDVSLNVYVFVHDREGQEWWAYGPAVREGSGTWTIHNVRFGEGVHQGQRFTLRAAIMPQPVTKRVLSGDEWQGQTAAVSDPVYVTVKKRLIQPYQQTISVEDPQIWLSTIGHQTTSATEAMVVPNAAGISGTIALNEEVVAEDFENGNAYVYGLVRSSVADRWRVFGPAIVNGVKWEIRHVSLGDPGEPQWARFKVSAILTREKFREEYLNYDQWWQQKLAASEPIEVSAKPHSESINLPYPEIELKYVQTFIDTQTVYIDQPFSVDSLQEVIQVGGHVEKLPQGASVWVLLNPIGTSLWEVHGKAIVTGDQWRLPLVHSRHLEAINIRKFRMMAIVSTATFKQGLINYDIWRRRTLGLSEGLVIEERQLPAANRDQVDLQILEIANEELEEDYNAIGVERLLGVRGEASWLPPGTAIWVATRNHQSENWQFSGPAFVNDDEWMIPAAQFEILVKNNETERLNTGYDVVAVATRGSLPVEALNSEELQWYSVATSPVEQISNSSIEQAPAIKLATLGGPPVFYAAILLLLLLLALEYYFGIISGVMAELSQMFQRMYDYMSDQFSEMPKPAVVPSAFALIILLLGIYGIYSYFPIYTHTLERVLNLPPRKSESLALLLIIFIGLAGVIAHLSIEYISDRQGNVLNRLFDYFLNYALPITILLVTLSLWGVQALLYLELYMDQVEAGNIRIPAAMGAAAFFIAGIETLGFYWVTRLGKDFFGWLIVHLLILGPPVILARFFHVMFVLFDAMPGRYKETEPAGIVHSETQ